MLVLSLAATLAGCRRRDDEAMALLAKARTAEQSVSLSGRVETELDRGGGQVTATADVSRTPDATVMRFVAGPIAGREIVRRNNEWIDADRGGRRPLSGGMESVPSPRELATRYDVRLGERTEIAGRPVQQVIVRPRRMGPGPEVSLWIDTDTGFPLGRERRDARGRVVSASRYVQVAYQGTPPNGAAPGAPSAALAPPPPGPNPPPPALGGPHVTETPPPGGGAPVPPAANPRGPGERRFPPPKLVSVDELSQALGVPVALPRFVPEGFAFKGAFLAQPDPERPAGQTRPRGGLRYTDGVHNLMVMVIPLRNAPGRRFPPEALQPGGAALIQQRQILAVAVRGQTVYLVSGALQEDVLRQVAASFS
ncbi:MAG TPA: sigma-E factor regulatory protein RseB domain-containing protein [Armatimonadota bacterium]